MAEDSDQRREREAEEARQRKRNEDIASEVKGRDDHNQDHQRAAPQLPGGESTASHASPVEAEMLRRPGA